jgi:hypothetical protein
MMTKITSQEDLLNIGKEVRRLMAKKKQADEHLIELEARIYSLETEYFKETGAYGSLLTGLEGYLGMVSGAGGQSSGGGMRRSAYREIKDSQRLFSNTSASSRKAVSLYGRYSGRGGGEDESTMDEDGDAEELGEDDEVLPSSAQKRSRPNNGSSSSNRNRRRK